MAYKVSLEISIEELLCMREVVLSDIIMSDQDEPDYADVETMEYYAARARVLVEINLLHEEWICGEHEKNGSPAWK